MALSDKSRFDTFIGVLLGAVAAAHVAMTLLVPDLAAKFQLGDRAWDRTEKLDALLRADGLDAVLAALFHNGAPGDYILFWPSYAAFGPAGVIVQNMALLLIGLWFLYRIGVTYFPCP